MKFIVCGQFCKIDHYIHIDTDILPWDVDTVILEYSHPCDLPENGGFEGGTSPPQCECAPLEWSQRLLGVIYPLVKVFEQKKVTLSMCFDVFPWELGTMILR